ncbi:hypothetical protein AVEN_115451-1 [Araneus ventricosus]|uniref:Uncharacterized protein n=1 Tax=Araneus ventricosus TaxID=182803 RepID=A0A4Y2Q146_ARAVE|nr:hypothetical protein AVEN_236071-1 [Araneus ventricosus]GBN57134.1 hypothetical protein AVEN_115451-1 [Araneus ventricosus]
MAPTSYTTIIAPTSRSKNPLTNAAASHPRARGDPRWDCRRIVSMITEVSHLLLRVTMAIFQSSLSNHHHGCNRVLKNHVRNLYRADTVVINKCFHCHFQNNWCKGRQ